MTDTTIWVGLDVHKDSITAAILEGDSSCAEVVRLPGDLQKVRKLFIRLSKRGAVRSCYEASSMGYVLYRRLTDQGISCQVIAPSLIPHKPGDRRKTDRLDAICLAKYLRSGHLTPVAVPTKEQEAVRSLVRYRSDLKGEIKRARNRIGSFALRQGLRFTGTKKMWTKAHRLWLSRLDQELDELSGLCLRTELAHLEYLESQLSALDVQIEEVAARDPYRPVVQALQCLRGVRTLTAITLVAEIGDIRRFRSPRSLMAWVGLVPSERSSGNIERRGPITKAGNREVRRLMIEGGWNNRLVQKTGLYLDRRRMGQDPAVVAIAVKAQQRLSRKFARLSRHKHANVAVTAVARELCGFVWAVMRSVPQPQV